MSSSGTPESPIPNFDAALGPQAAATSPTPPQYIDDRFIPSEPKSFKDVGVHPNEILPIVLKFLFLHGAQPGRTIAQQLKMPFNLILPLLEELKSEMLIGRKAVHGVGDYMYEPTAKGVEQAKIAMKRSSYCGAIAVPIEQYRKSVEIQAVKNYRPTMQDVAAAMSDLVTSRLMLSQLGQAVNSGRSLFLFGPPGNGKTSIAQRIIRSISDHIWIPRALTVGGEIIRLYDPALHVHQPFANNQVEGNLKIDERWIRIQRPTIVVGGELTLQSLESTLNPITGILESPLHVKSNCGCLVVDDFGRQQISKTQLLNRWIIPMESGLDYLVLPSGRQISMPFEQLLVFSTNLKPGELCDEAFLRRIPYKIEVFNPTEQQFRELFLETAEVMGFEVENGVIEDVIEYHYKRVGRPFRFCHPKDLLIQARDFCEFHRCPLVLSRDVAELAVLNYFSGMDDIHHS